MGGGCAQLISDHLCMARAHDSQESSFKRFRGMRKTSFVEFLGVGLDQDLFGTYGDREGHMVPSNFQRFTTDFQPIFATNAQFTQFDILSKLSDNPGQNGWAM